MAEIGGTKQPKTVAVSHIMYIVPYPIHLCEPGLLRLPQNTK